MFKTNLEWSYLNSNDLCVHRMVRRDDMRKTGESKTAVDVARYVSHFAVLSIGLIILLYAYTYELCSCHNFAVVQLVEALRYKPEGRRFDSRW